MQPGWCQPVRQEFMENKCEALPGVAYPGVRDNRSTLNTKTGYDDDTHIHQTASFAKMWLRPNVFILFLTFRVIHCATGQVQLLFQVTT